jgi:hypothetical protein
LVQIGCTRRLRFGPSKGRTRSAIPRRQGQPHLRVTAVTELKFLKACTAWAFPINFTLAKTGLQVGELVHLLIEDVHLTGRSPTPGSVEPRFPATGMPPG